MFNIFYFIYGFGFNFNIDYIINNINYNYVIYWCIIEGIMDWYLGDLIVLVLILFLRGCVNVSLLFNFFRDLFFYF